MTSSTLTRPWRGVSAADRVAERRRRLLDAGLQLLGTRGIAGVGVGDVCAEAGLTKRYFYESFGSIEVFVDAVVEDVLERLTALVVPVLREHGPANPRPAALVLAEAMLDDPRLVRLLVVETHAGALMHYRARFIDRAIATWLATQFPGEEDADVVLRRRFLAHACAGAIGELLAAFADGRLAMGPDQFVDWTLGFYEQLAAIR
jgi:AcrR family transcriptional regulator